MRAAILGAGAIGLGMTAFLADRGHQPILWSPSGRGTARFRAGEPLRATGKVEGDFVPTVAGDIAEAVGGADCVVVAVPGQGQRAVIEALAPHLRGGTPVIISSMLSLSALLLSRRLAERNLAAPIVTFGSTVLTARRTDETSVAVLALRRQLDMATIPARDGPAGESLCRTLFGERFVRRETALHTSFGNLNPVAHIGLVLANATRIERREDWPQYFYMTDAVSRLILGLDAERRRVAAAFGVTVPSIEEHFHRSFDVPLAPLAEMARTLHQRRGGPPGPIDMETRFVVEDVPFGAVFLEEVGPLAGIATPLHSAAITVLSSLWDRDFRAGNDLLPALGLRDLGREDLARRVENGWAGTRHGA